MGYTNTFEHGTSVELQRAPEYGRVGVKSMWCLIVMPNGYEIIGTSAVVDPANFDEELGKRYSLEDALRKAQAVAAYVATGAPL